MDCGYCSFGFHEKMGNISNTFTRWMAAKSWGLYLFHYLFIAMTAYYLGPCIQNFRQCFFIFLWQLRDLPVHIWPMRSSAVFRCSGGSSVELEEKEKIMFADNLIQLRKLNHMSQDELADQIGVSRQTLSKYETGESLPDIEKCKRLADVFGVTVDDLINYEKKDSLGLEVPPKGKHIFGMVKVGEKGQIVIPAKARKIFDIRPGDNLIVLGDEGQGIALIKEKGLLDLLKAAKGRTLKNFPHIAGKPDMWEVF